MEKLGPVLPIQLCRELKINTIFAGALLSDLNASKKIKISHAKIGSSPVYYIPGQEEKLSLLYSHLKEPEKKVYDLLKEKIIMDDFELNPLQRVALKEITDFAIPLNLTNGKIFWKWYLTSDEEAEILIKNILEPKEEVLEEPKKEVSEEPKEEIKETTELEIDKETQKKLEPKKLQYDLFPYLSSKEMEVLEQESIKKNTEYNLIVNLASTLGNLKYFLKFRSKKIISDKDLILAQHESQNKRLPLIYLTTGKLTKKAEKYAESSNIIIQKHG